MRLGKFGYFFDFALCPPLVAYFGYHAFRDLAMTAVANSAFSFFCGLFAWTLTEYLVHRYLFHGAPILRGMHAAHHAEPDRFIGSPPGSLPLAIVLLANGLLFSFDGNVSAAATAGLLVGYFFYSLVHYMTHQISGHNSRYFVAAKRRHMLHHFRPEDVNFGVTTGFWDYVFDTTFETNARTTRQETSS